MEIIQSKKIISLLFMTSIFTVQTVSAVIWRQDDTVVPINNNWNASNIVANYSGVIADNIPEWVVEKIDSHITHTATNNYANGFGGYNVSNSGSMNRQIINRSMI